MADPGPSVDLRECDFRLGLNPSCPAQDFFRIVYSILLAIVSVSFVLAVFDISWRSRRLKQPLSRGLNLGLCDLAFIEGARIIHYSLVLSSASSLASEAFWTINFGFLLVPPLLQSDLMAVSIPQFKVSLDHIPKVYLNQRVRKYGSMLFLALLSLPPLVLLLLSDHFRLNPATLGYSRALFMAGMGFLGILYIGLATFLCWLIEVFRRTLGHSLEAISKNEEVKQNSENFAFMHFTITKLMQSIRSAIVICFAFGAYFLILGFYGDLFRNTVASQVIFGVVMLLFEVVILHLHVLYVIFSVRKHQLDSAPPSQESRGTHASLSKMDASVPPRLADTAGDPMDDFMHSVKTQGPTGEV